MSGSNQLARVGGVRMFIAHSKAAISIARRHGWFQGARYTNLRDIKTFNNTGVAFLDIDWKSYSFDKHLEAVKEVQPYLTIARDVESIFDLDKILYEARLLAKYSTNVAIVPKDVRLSGRFSELIPKDFMLAYSVPTKYGGTAIHPSSFDRPVHLLGGRPDVQRVLASQMPVMSIDCNRFTYDARFGDYFDGMRFVPHPSGGYETCLESSIRNINKIWEGYASWQCFSNGEVCDAR